MLALGLSYGTREKRQGLGILDVGSFMGGSKAAAQGLRKPCAAHDSPGLAAACADSIVVVGYEDSC